MSAATVRIPALDGVRGVAILLVIVWHYIANQWTVEPWGLGAAIVRMMSLTWGGVDLFFVLSGFLIAGILLDHRDAPSYFKAFYVRRACRILPLYVLLIGSYAIVRHGTDYKNVHLFNDDIPLASYATFTQNFFMHLGGFGPRYISHTWSLAIEEQFYVVLPVLVRFLHRKTLVIVFLAAILMAPVFRATLGVLGAYVFPFARADAILMGALVAVMVRDDDIRAALARHRDALLRSLVIVGLGLVALSAEDLKYGDPFVHLWMALAGGLLLVVVVPLDDSPAPLERFFDNVILRWFGTRSYAIYLVHPLFAALVHEWAGNTYAHFTNLWGFALTLGALVVVIAFAEASYRLLETPILRLGHRVNYAKT